MSQPFDFDKALKALQSGQALTGKDGILTPLIKQLTEAALAAELDPIWLRMWKLTVKTAPAKRPLKPRPAALNWQPRAIVTVLLSLNW